MPARFRTGLLWAGAIGGGLALGLSGSEPEESSISFLAVGQGDCAVIRAQGLTVLIDAGPADETFDAGSRIVARELREMGVDSVDLLLLTHPDADHIGGLPGLNARIPVRRVAVSEAFRGHPELVATFEKAGITDHEVAWLRADHLLRTASMELLVRVPNGLEPESDNEGSLFVKVRLRGLTAVLSGDAGAVTEAIQAGRGNWRADILKAGHHGSGGSTSGFWLNEVAPKVVVVSCGAGNRFGHPAPATVDRIRRQGANLLRTDQDGTITFVAAGSGFRQIVR